MESLEPEHIFRNQQVAGSSPAGGSSLNQSLTSPRDAGFRVLGAIVAGKAVPNLFVRHLRPSTFDVSDSLRAAHDSGGGARGGCDRFMPVSPLADDDGLLSVRRRS